MDPHTRHVQECFLLVLLAATAGSSIGLGPYHLVTGGLTAIAGLVAVVTHHLVFTSIERGPWPHDMTPMVGARHGDREEQHDHNRSYAEMLEALGARRKLRTVALAVLIPSGTAWLGGMLHTLLR